MIYDLIVSHKAHLQIKEAAEYYETQKEGLGNKFLDELDECIQKLKFHPQFYSFISEEKILRSLACKKFPYQIIFEIAGNKVIIFSVHNTYRKRI